jgi:type 1 glutamine amidotransferase
MKRLIHCVLAAGLLTFTISAELRAADDRSTTRLLIVTGIDYPGHRWQETTPALQELLGKDARIRSTVLDDPYKLGVTDLSGFDVLILHFMNWEKPDPNTAAQANLLRFVERGGGLVILHFACGAFRDWPEYANLAGRIYDRVNTHDPRGPFTVEISNSAHPLVRGLRSFETDDELYVCLAGTKPVEVLATARSKLTHRDHPMALVHSYGRGRVFLTPLGHDVKALRIAGTAELIRRAVLWSAGRAAVAPNASHSGAHPQPPVRP